MNQFSFGWNRDETLGGDLVFLDIVEASENASSMDNSQAGFETDNLIALKASADRKSAWVGKNSLKTLLSFLCIHQTMK